MQTPAELRELAAYHRRIAMTASRESQVWRVRLADYLEDLAAETERAKPPATDSPVESRNSAGAIICWWNHGNR